MDTLHNGWTVAMVATEISVMGWHSQADQQDYKIPDDFSRMNWGCILHSSSDSKENLMEYNLHFRFLAENSIECNH